MMTNVRSRHGRRHRRPHLPGPGGGRGPARARWRVHWLGAPGSMESQLVPPRGFAFETIAVLAACAARAPMTLVLLPLRLLRPSGKASSVVRRVKPDVVIGLGGYITFPAGMMSVLLGKPLVLHEQNSVAGMANKVLAGVADRVFTAFPNVLKKAAWVGNPLRAGLPAAAGPGRALGRRAPARCGCWWSAAAWAPGR